MYRIYLFLLFVIFSSKISEAQNCPLIAITNLQVVNGTANNLTVGDKLKSVSVIVHNGIAYDAIIEIKTLNIGAGATLAVSGMSNLLIRNAIPNTNPYVTYNLYFVPTGSTNTTPSALPNVSLTQSDVDGNNVTTFSDLGGYSTANTGTPSIIKGSNLVNSGFLNGTTGTGPVGPSGFNLFRATSLSATCPGTVRVINTTPTDLTYGVIMTYDSFTNGEFIFGMTGCGTVAIGERAQNLSISAPYSCPNPPTADNDSNLNNTAGTTVEVNMIEGDLLNGGSPVSADKISINFIAPNNVSTISENQIVVPGEGTWSYSPENGIITFEPETSFKGNPTPISYSITELETLKTSNVATVTITYNAALPLKLDWFKSTLVEKNILLTWKTSSEHNVQHIEIQKGVNTSELSTIETILPQKNNIYNVRDLNPVEGIQYYRLKIVDLDGSISYSKIISLIFDEKINSNVVVNPVINGVIQLNSKSKNPKIFVINSFGKVLLINIKVVNENLFEIELLDKTTGIVFLTIEEKGGIETKKILLL